MNDKTDKVTVVENKAIELPKPTAAKRITVKLLAPHRHNGNDYAIDAELVVDVDAAAFITNNKIGVEIK